MKTPRQLLQNRLDEMVREYDRVSKVKYMTNGKYLQHFEELKKIDLDRINEKIKEFRFAVQVLEAL